MQIINTVNTCNRGAVQTVITYNYVANLKSLALRLIIIHRSEEEVQGTQAWQQAAGCRRVTSCSKLGLSSGFIFQQDSTTAYLYTHTMIIVCSVTCEPDTHRHEIV